MIQIKAGFFLSFTSFWMVCRIKKVTEEMLIVMVRCKSTSSYSCHIVCMLVHASAGQEIPSGVIPQVESAFFFFFLRQVTWNFSGCLGWLEQVPRICQPLPPQCRDHKDVCPCSAFLFIYLFRHGSWGSSSDPRAFKESISLTALSSSPCYIFYSTKV